MTTTETGPETERGHWSQRVAELGGEGAFEVLQAARRLEAAGRDVVHLEIGEPRVPTAPHIVETAVRALRDGHTTYAPPAGLPALREAIADDAGQRGLAALPENVVVTSGAKPMLLYAALALLEPGDEALVPDPGFPIYPSVVRLAGARPVPYPLDPVRGWGVDPDAIAERVTSRTRVLVLNAPHNPTGGVAGAEDLARIAALAARRDLAIVSDEVYGRLCYDGPHRSIASLPGMARRTIVVDGFSKAYAMTGWRLGFGIMPAVLAERVTALVVNSTSCAPPFVQLAGVAALTGPQDALRDLITHLRTNRDVVVAGLNALSGIQCPPPAGAFYVFPNVNAVLQRGTFTTEQFASRLLEHHGVALLPGTAFGPGGAEHLRISYATTRVALENALARLRESLLHLATAA